MPDVILPTLLTVNELAEYLGVCDETIRNWIRSGKIEAKKLPNGIYRIERSELKKILT